MFRNNYTESRTVIRHGSLYLITRFAGAGLQLTLLILLTRLLVPEEYGKISLFTATYSFSIVIFCNPWRHAVTRFLPDEVARFPVFEKTIAKCAAASLLLFAGVLLTALVFPQDRYVALPVIAVPLMIAVAAGSWTEINLEFHRRRLRPLEYLKLFLTRSSAHLLFATGGALYFKTGLGVIWGLVAGHAIATLMTPVKRWFRSFSREKISNSAALVAAKPWLAYGLPLTLAEFVNASLVYTDRFMIASSLGVSEVGLFSAAHDLTWMGLHVISVVAYLTFFPMAISARESQDDTRYVSAMAHGFTLLFGLSLASSVGLILMAKPVTGLVLGPEFQTGAAQLMMVIAVTHLLYVLKVYWLDTSFSIHKKTGRLLLIGVIVVAANITSNALLIPVYGVLGASFGTGMASLLGCFLSAFFSRWVGTTGGVPKFPVIWPDILKVILATSLMAGTLLLLPQTLSLNWLLLNVAVGGGVFVAALWACRPLFFKAYFR